MSRCCSCSTRGRCQNCSYIKNGLLCSNCQPNRIGRCENQEADSRTGPSSATSIDTASPIEDLSVPSVASNVDPMQNILASAHPLPTFLPLNKPNFRWSESIDVQTFVDLVVKAYEDVVHWRQNVFFCSVWQDQQGVCWRIGLIVSWLWGILCIGSYSA